MEPIARRTKKMAKKSFLNTGKPARQQAEKKVPAVPTSYSTNWREEEELVGYGPEDPPAFSLAEDELSTLGDRSPTPEQGTADISPSKDDFAAYPAEDAVMMAGQKRRPNFQKKKSSAARWPKTIRQPLLGGG